ncbi:MAG: hypothetical protein ABIN74_14455 [Ferruginibacter sp.]
MPVVSTLSLTHHLQATPSLYHNHHHNMLNTNLMKYQISNPVLNPLLVLLYVAAIIFITAISIKLLYGAFQAIHIFVQVFSQQAGPYFTQFLTRN